MTSDSNFWKVAEKCEPNSYQRFRFCEKMNQTRHYIPRYNIFSSVVEPEYQIFCALFKQLIVKAYTTNQNQKVILIFHSMGSVVTRYCLRNFTQDFKDKYILVLISLSGVCGGTVKILDILTGKIYLQFEKKKVAHSFFGKKCMRIFP